MVTFDRAAVAWPVAPPGFDDIDMSVGCGCTITVAMFIRFVIVANNGGHVVGQWEYMTDESTNSQIGAVGKCSTTDCEDQ